MLNIVKTAKILFLSTSLALTCQLSFASAPQQASIDRLIELSKLDQVFKESLQHLKPFFQQESEGIVGSLVQSDQLNKEQQKVASQLATTMMRFTQDTLNNPLVKQKIREVIKDTYTEEELKAYNAFLSTPEGQSVNLKSSKVSIELQSFMENLIKTATEQEGYEEEIEKIISPLIEQ